MTHLDDLAAAALVDQELSHDARDRAFAHLADCAGCRAEVDAQRRLKSLLAHLPTPEPDPALTARLLAVPALGGDVVRRPAPAARLERPSGARPVTALGRRRRPAGRPAHHRRRTAVRSVSALAVACGVVLALGGADSREPRVRPPVGNFVQDHTATTIDLPLNDPGAAVVLTSLAR